MIVINTSSTSAICAHSKRSPPSNDLSASANYIEARIPVGHNPRGLALSPDGSRLYVANRLDDSVTIIDTHTNKAVSTFGLGSTKKISPLRQGEQIFITAKYAFQGQFGCANCHIDATFDALQWDLEPDGFGVDVVDNRLLEDVKERSRTSGTAAIQICRPNAGRARRNTSTVRRVYSDQDLTDLALYVRNIAAAA